jgi:UDP-galactopyranose mutase
MKYDYIVIGAGIAGIIITRLLADKDKQVLILEKRSHIGGNCYDEYVNGVLVHRYGPHIFHTDNEKVWKYLNQFTEFNDYKHKVKVSIDDKIYDLPVNYNTITNLKYDYRDMNDESLDTIGKLYISENFKGLAKELYNKIYKNYSKKQWGKYFDSLDESVLNRLSIRYSFNENYFVDKYQGLPIDGYTRMFENMLFHKNIEIELNHKKQSIDIDENNIIYTGMIDELFNYQYGKLPYRSLDIEFKEYKKEYYQKYPVINYPNKKRLTRKTEYKYLTKQKCNNTVISKEYPCEYDGINIPYYPIITNETEELYNKYKSLADKIPNLYLLGRLAEYKYYDMNTVVEKALNLVEEL